MDSGKAKKIGIVGVIIILIALFQVFDLSQFLSLEYLKSSRETLARLYAENTFLVIAAYFFIYVLVTSLSLPGAAVMTLAGGAVFGLVTGTIIVSFASTIGATMACIVSRYLLQHWVQSRFGEKLTTINEGLEKEGAFYLFTMRLIPAFPFFLINLAMGLSKLPVRTFYWVSQLGMLPGTIVYVNAGKELGKIDSLGSILSPSLLISFALLGVLPITLKKLIALYRRKRGAAETQVKE
ncbi:MAG: TVP38/TMEM64 family protein [Desulfofustis sp.]|nr:TVP38/TMEM64 family protein [Desulfofustis sp.]NNF45291.1 TVP38/TMEM64 family protein [Desulfofustis sp.]NNK58124.1 TVP38/TMEM64 family protein [Desulfofustis sp.]